MSELRIKRSFSELKTALPSPVKSTSPASPTLGFQKAPILPKLTLPKVGSPRSPRGKLTVRRIQSVPPQHNLKIAGVTLSQLSALYHARCEDLTIPVIPEQEARFFMLCTGLLDRRRLDLKECGIGKNSAKVIGKILSSDNHFGIVNLSRNSLGDSGAVSIVEQLVGHLGVAHLDLSSNDITSEGATAVFRLLKDNESIVSLSLSSSEGINRNRLRVKGATALGKLLKTSQILTHLNLAGTLIKNDGIAYLAEGLRGNTSLLVLNIARNDLSDVELFFTVIAHTRLEELNLAQNKIGDSGVEVISNMFYSKQSQLMKIDISRNSISSKPLTCLFESLIKNVHLKSLNLEGNNFSKGLSANFIQLLKKNEILSTLNLAQTQLSDCHVKGLAMGLPENIGIITLNLANNSITDKGASCIAEGLPAALSLKYLNLSGNSIKNDGCSDLAQSLKKHPGIVTLNLNNNKIKNRGAEHLFELAKKNQHLISLSLENNPADLKYTKLINSTCKAHIKNHLTKEVPTIKGNIEKLKSSQSGFEKVKGELGVQKKLKRQHTLKLNRQISRLQDVTKQESLKVKTLLSERSVLREESYKLSETLIDLQANNKLHGVEINRGLNNYKEMLGISTYDIRLIEKNKIKLKQETAMKRLDSEHIIEKLRKELKSEENTLAVAKIKLEGVKEQLQRIKESRPKTSRFKRTGEISKCTSR